MKWRQRFAVETGVPAAAAAYVGGGTTVAALQLWEEFTVRSSKRQ